MCARTQFDDAIPAIVGCEFPDRDTRRFCRRHSSTPTVAGKGVVFLTIFDTYAASRSA
jgi:hypothetical protein